MAVYLKFIVERKWIYAAVQAIRGSGVC